MNFFNLWRVNFVSWSCSSLQLPMIGCSEICRRLKHIFMILFVSDNPKWNIVINIKDYLIISSDTLLICKSKFKATLGTMFLRNIVNEAQSAEPHAIFYEGKCFHMVFFIWCKSKVDLSWHSFYIHMICAK